MARSSLGPWSAVPPGIHLQTDSGKSAFPGFYRLITEGKVNHCGRHRNKSSFRSGGFGLLIAMTVVLAACSFNYDTASGSDKARPDIVMDNLEYVRVRGGDPLVRFKAEHAERWEESQTMDLTNFSFEQLQDQGKTINAEGQAGGASVQLNSGDLSLKDGVSISIQSEDITIRTTDLDWKDKDKTLTGSADGEVDIDRSDGTSFTGRGFSADARNRTWDFSGAVTGQYVEKDQTKSGDQAEESTVSDDQTVSQAIQEQTSLSTPSADEQTQTSPAEGQAAAPVQTPPAQGQVLAPEPVHPVQEEVPAPPQAPPVTGPVPIEEK